MLPATNPVFIFIAMVIMMHFNRNPLNDGNQ